MALRVPDAGSDDFVRVFINAHARQALAALKKPLLLEEFSAVGPRRTALYRLATDIVMSTPVRISLVQY